MIRSILPGDKVAGKYRIVRALGKGGMGSVYLAEHERLNRQVAIKVLHSQRSHVETAVVRFEREIKAMAMVRNCHVAEALDADVLDDGSLFLVMEYLEGRDLRAELRLRRAIPYPEAVAYIMQACEGVAAVHEVGIIHRDLKPHNLFVTNLTGARCVKVLDFGVAKFLAGTDASMTATDTSVGTPLYMSPEQLSSPTELSPRIDVWALGVVLYELIAGVSPFSSRGPGAVVAAIMLEEPALLSRIVSDVPESLAEVIVDALVKAPSRRIGSVREFAARLARFGMPTDKIIVESMTVSRRPAIAPQRQSARPDLSARIEHEVDRLSEKMNPDEASTESDQPLRIPSLARLSIPLTSAATPLARQADSPTWVRDGLHDGPNSPPKTATCPPEPVAARRWISPGSRVLLRFGFVLLGSGMAFAIVWLKRRTIELPNVAQSAEPIRIQLATPTEGAAPQRSTVLEPASSAIIQADVPTTDQRGVTVSANRLRSPTLSGTRLKQSGTASRLRSPTPSPIPSAADGKPLHL